MNFKKLGNTNLDVSTICLGTMTWGEQNSEKDAFDQMDLDMFTKQILLPLSQGAASQITDAWLPRTVEVCKRSQFCVSLSELNVTNHV